MSYVSTELLLSILIEERLHWLALVFILDFDLLVQIKVFLVFTLPCSIRLTLILIIILTIWDFLVQLVILAGKTSNYIVVIVAFGIFSILVFERKVVVLVIVLMLVLVVHLIIVVNIHCDVILLEILLAFLHLLQIFELL